MTETKNYLAELSNNEKLDLALELTKIAMSSLSFDVKIRHPLYYKSNADTLVNIAGTIFDETYSAILENQLPVLSPDEKKVPPMKSSRY